MVVRNAAFRGVCYHFVRLHRVGVVPQGPRIGHLAGAKPALSHPQRADLPGKLALVEHFEGIDHRKVSGEDVNAADGEKAVDVFRKNGEIDLVILDSVMPKKNGREAYEEIKKISPDIKALFISGHTRDTRLDKGIADEEVDFLPKPLSPIKLLQTIREILDRN
jgi:CheY-like chemotaxis protein